MEKIGIICEYNPLHNGHIYHFKKIKEMHPDSLIILVLNGYFLQRGEISIISKYDKVRLALDMQVDIVVELPCIFGTQSADTFAKYAVWYLNKLKASHIIFGSESNDIKTIKKLAKTTSEPSYNKCVKRYLDEGLNYPTALAKALNVSFSFEPNDLLAISYVKAINIINEKIEPQTIKRTSSYHDIKSKSDIVSASNIREKLKKKEDVSKYLPQKAIEKINNINNLEYFNILKSIIIHGSNLNDILDVDEGIEYRLIKCVKAAKSLDEFIFLVKSKRYTYNKINRMLVHILLNIKKDTSQITPTYLKILGLNKKGQKYINGIKKEIDISLNPDKNSFIYETEIKASILYDILTNQNTYEEEKSCKPIFKD